MEFIKFRDTVKANFDDMGADFLFEVAFDKDELWNLYLDSFPEGTNEIYRVRSEHDCSCCRGFIKNVGGVVTIEDGKLRSIWDVEEVGDTYAPVAKALSDYVKSKAISGAFLSQFANIGQLESFERLDNGSTIKYDHFHVLVPTKCITRSIGDKQNDYRTSKQVFKRSLEEISIEATETILELTAQNSLYRGEEWVGVLREFLKHQKAYAQINGAAEKDLYAWENSVKVGGAMSRIRNHSIGTLLTDITDGVDLDEAVKKYERIVAPQNYKRPNAIFTAKMLEDAKRTITDLGYMDSLNRRFANLDDITVNNIMFSNKDASKRIVGSDDLFATMEKDVKPNPKKFSKVEEIGIDAFIADVLPSASEVEVYLENKHANNMVSLIAPINPDAKTMFKWNNGFSWAYTGNLADSLMKERVKEAGGKVDGDLRFSIQWNDVNYDPNDLDAHCKTPTHLIYYASKIDRNTHGVLDVDIITPHRGKPAVENITWATRNNMVDGEYKFYVHCFSNRGGTDGFRAEIEFDGNIYSYDYSGKMRTDDKIHVATVTLKDGVFTIKEHLESSMTVKDVWGLSTNQFVPVHVVCTSPNYWDAQDGIGNKHYFFMLKDCVNPEQPRSIFNEFLKEELMPHKRVLEALGAKAHVQDTEDQLSGIGFASTKRAELIVKVKGATERVLKVKF